MQVRDYEADLVVKKSKKSKARRVFSSDDESSDEAPVRSKKKKAKQDMPKKSRDEKFLGGLRCAPGKALYGLDGYVPIQRTCVDKIPAIRSWGGVGGANIKNPATPLAPQTRRTTEY